MRLIIAIAATLCLLPGYSYSEECEYAELSRESIEKIIIEASAKEGVDSDLVWSMVYVESHFDPCVVSEAGAIGLMQLMPCTAKDLRVKDPFNPKENIEAGTRLIDDLIERHEILQLALAAYNAGPNAVKRYRRAPPNKQTKRYIRKVFAAMEKRKGVRSDWFVWSKEDQQ